MTLLGIVPGRVILIFQKQLLMSKEGMGRNENKG